MAFLRQLLLVLFALILSGGQLFASTREQRDFAVAVAAFNDAMWSRAEVGFAQFIEKHPKSTLIPEAALMQAQADFKQGKLVQAIALLHSREPSSGTLADQYAYWIGQAEFQNGDYSDAAETFAQVVRDFPESQWQMDALINEADAFSKLGQPARTVALLQKRDGIFENAAKTNAMDSRVLNGRLLLAESLLAENQPTPATAVLQSSAAFKNNQELDWRRLYLLCQARLAAGDTNEALELTAKLIKNAGRADLQAQSVAQRADILQSMGRLSHALSIYREDLTNNAPADWQRQAILKIAELSATLTNFSGAEDWLQKFQSRFPDSTANDSVMLGLGELHLKSYVSCPSGTNDDLPQAHSCFDQFIGAYTNSSLLGKAFLDRGWCFWIEEKWPQSAADFQTAVEKLPPSVDLAVAHFKLADAQFRLNDLAGARDNYQAVVNDFTNFPVVAKALGAQALYQTLCACYQLNDVPGMSNAMSQILKIYPESNETESGILLVGQGLSDLGQPEHARVLFQKFESVFPNSPQLPEVELAVARTYEQQGNWPQAISLYNSWINDYTNNTRSLPKVEYARAWANFQGGYETNAFLLFTNFLAEYPSNNWTPMAEWWLGDYNYGQGHWADAEEYYELVFQNHSSELSAALSFPAYLMAARSALGRQDYGAATNYLLSLMGDTNCPPVWDAQAWFTYGDVLMQAPSSDTNDPLANFKQAIQYFQYVGQQYAGNGYDWSPLAWGEMGDCYLQLATQDPQHYSDATNAYAQVMALPNAQIAERSQAQIGIGMVLEKLAALANNTNQPALLQAALDNYLDVFFGNNLRNGEMADPFWVKKAGLQALPLIESLGTGDPDRFIDQMETLLPQLKDSLEKKRLEIHQPKSQ